MNFMIYLIGFAILVGGIAWAAITAGAPQQYVAIGVVIMAGLGIMSAVINTRRREGGNGTGSDVTVIKD